MGCSSCSGTSYYQCTGCLSFYYLLHNQCLTRCPSGYFQDSPNKICTLLSNPALNIVFNNDILLDVVDEADVGSDNTNKYPNLQTSDAIPAYLRGYYFDSGRYVAKNSFYVSIRFSVLLWIRAKSSGYVVLKSDGTNEYLKVSISLGGIPSLTLRMNDASVITVSGISDVIDD